MVDARAIIQAFRAQKRPPYECPLCKKIYKSFSGAEYHVNRAIHNEDGSVTPRAPSSRLTPRSQKQKKKRRSGAQGNAPARPPSPSKPAVLKEELSYADSLLFVQFEVDCAVDKWLIKEEMELAAAPEATETDACVESVENGGTSVEANGEDVDCKDGGRVELVGGETDEKRKAECDERVKEGGLENGEIETEEMDDGKEIGWEKDASAPEEAGHGLNGTFVEEMESVDSDGLIDEPMRERGQIALEALPTPGETDEPGRLLQLSVEPDVPMERMGEADDNESGVSEMVIVDDVDTDDESKSGEKTSNQTMHELQEIARETSPNSGETHVRRRLSTPPVDVTEETAEMQDDDSASELVVIDDGDNESKGGKNSTDRPMQELDQSARETPRRPSQTPKSRRPPQPRPKPAPPELPTPKVRAIDPLPTRTPREQSVDYRNFVEKPVEQLEAEVEYDMDEEDCAWLSMANEKRATENAEPVPEATFEFLMDRFEKESFFESRRQGDDSNGDPAAATIDENAVCSICNDGECQNSNAILFCDMCNLAVHQDCYGVPYIPEGQWLCRRCLHSPSRPVDCGLCPNKGGAFKQTDDGRWAHVICALWIPECGFANPVFLEPIDGIQEIPAARWKLNCCICKRRQGACVQCVRNNCYTAFHPTCAQQAGLYLKIEPAMDERTGEATVRKVALCDLHSLQGSMSPSAEEADAVAEAGVEEEGGASKKSSIVEKIRAKAQEAFRKSRMVMEERGRQISPILSLPHVPPRRLGKITTQVSLKKKLHFLNSLYNYWMLKRQSRSGVPLIRRLQASQQEKQSSLAQDLDDDDEIKECDEQWRLLRQDLEKARMLVELVKKREKLKRDLAKIEKTAVELRVEPLVAVLKKAAKSMKDKDTGRVFARPVSLHLVKDYLDVIDLPMDLQTMNWKVMDRCYGSLDEFAQDFDLMINNALVYNDKESYYFRMAMKMREYGGLVIQEARRALVKSRVEKGGPQYLMGKDDTIPPTAARPDLAVLEQLDDLNEKMKAAEVIRHEGARLQRLKQLKKDVSLMKKRAAKEKVLAVKSTLPAFPVETPAKVKPLLSGQGNMSDASRSLPTNSEQWTSGASTMDSLNRQRRSSRSTGEESKDSKKLELNFIDMGIRLWKKKQKRIRVRGETVQEIRPHSTDAEVNGDSKEGMEEEGRQLSVVETSIMEKRPISRSQKKRNCGRPPGKPAKIRRTSTESLASSGSSNGDNTLTLMETLAEEERDETMAKRHCRVSNGHIVQNEEAMEDDDDDDDEEEEDENDKDSGERDGTDSESSDSSEDERRTYNLRQHPPAREHYTNDGIQLRSSRKHSEAFVNSPAWRQPLRHHFRHRRHRDLVHESSTSSSSESGGDEKHFEERKKRSMGRARRCILPMNISRKDMMNVSMKERVRVGASLADIDPMNIDTNVGFPDVGGLEHHVESLQEMIVFPLLYPEVFTKFNVKPQRGVLFYGPPGTGKTLLARALANECSKGKQKVAFFMRKGADCLSKWVGESERQLRLLFDQAYQMRPSIIFFDEIDGLAPVRSSRQDQIHSSIVSTLLALMDGLDSRGEVIVIGATNRIDAIDPALRRPGRFDSEFLFPMPTQRARNQILSIHTKGWQPSLDASFIDELASLTTGYCGADLQAVCTKAALFALRRVYPQIYHSMQKLAIDIEKVTVEKEDLLKTLKVITPSAQRSASSPGQPFTNHIRPLLHSCLKELHEGSQRLLSGWTGPLTSASVLGGLDHMIQAFHPGVLVCGKVGMGQVDHVGPALLHALEGLPCHVISLDCIFESAAKSPDEVCVQVIREAKKRSPSILYLPDLMSIWETVTSSFHSVFLSLMNGMKCSTSVLTIATCEMALQAIPKELRSLFCHPSGIVKEMMSPTKDERLSYFENVISLATVEPPQKQEEITSYPELPVVQLDSARELSEKEKKHLEKQRASTLRELRIFLRDHTNKLITDRKFAKFIKPVEQEEAPDYFEVIEEPMTLSTIMDKVDKGKYMTPNQWLEDINLIARNCIEYNPDKELGHMLRHRAIAMQDVAHAWISRDMDSDFEMLCEEFEEGRKEREKANEPNVEESAMISRCPNDQHSSKEASPTSSIASDNRNSFLCESGGSARKERLRNRRHSSHLFDPDSSDAEENPESATCCIIADRRALTQLKQRLVANTQGYSIRELEKVYCQLSHLLCKHKDNWDKSQLIKEMTSCVEQLQKN
eukprot:m.191381 g.191381  ORF g.191381 m.191381 type:complete len:2209 (+) comp39449_c0_seq4:329-6955(+)